MRSRSEDPAKNTDSGQAVRRAAPASGGLNGGPLGPATITLLQRLAGGPDASRAPDNDQHVHGAGCGHESSGDSSPLAQSELLHSAMSSPSRPLSGPLRTEAEAFYQNDLSPTLIHDNPVAQRATVALGAEAMTVHNHVFLAPGAGAKKDVIGHELGHVDKNLRGIRETGKNNGAGVSVTDPDQGSERAATTDGAAFAAGVRTAPSLGLPQGAGQEAPGAVQRSAGPGGSQRPVGDPASATMLALQRSAGNAAVSRLLNTGVPPVQRASVTKEKDAIDAEVKAKWTLLYGAGRQGRGHEEVRKRYARSMKDDATAQTLSHLAFLTYDSIEAKKEEKGTKSNLEREVQGMLINNRLLFASNYNESMDLFKSNTSAGNGDPFRDIMSEHQSDKGRRKGGGKEYVERLDRAELKTKAVMSYQRGNDDDATAQALQKRLGKPVALLDTDNPALHMLLTDEKYEGSIFFVRQAGDENLVHAELKLLSILDKSGIKPREVRGAHAIMGRYRGCLCCTAALMYYKSKFSSLDFDPNPGFYYKESLDNLAKHHKHVVLDPDFRKYMMQLVDDLPSTPAGSNAIVPDDAYENNGPEKQVPGGEAATRNYRTASSSDVSESEDAQGYPVYTSRHREPYIDEEEQTARRIGAGTVTDTGYRNTTRWVIDKKEDRDKLRRTWTEGTTEEKRERLRNWRERGAGLPELAHVLKKVDNREETALKTAIGRIQNDTTGHKNSDRKRKESEDSKVVRMPQRGKNSQQAPARKRRAKGDSESSAKPMTKKSSGWNMLFNEMVKDPSFYTAWLRLENKKEEGSIQPRHMSEGLADLVTDLSPKYQVSTMGVLLHIAPRSLNNRVTKIRDERAAAAQQESYAPLDEPEGLYDPSAPLQQPSYLQDTFDEPEGLYDPPTPRQQPSYPQDTYMGGMGDEDIPMLDTAPYAMEQSYEPTYANQPQYAPQYSMQDVTFTGQQEYPDIQGYRRITDVNGEVFYEDATTRVPYRYNPQTGRLYPA